MFRKPQRRLAMVEQQSLLSELLTQQQLRRQQTMAQSIRAVAEEFGIPEDLVARAIEFVAGDEGQSPIGDLKRGHLVRYARELYRLWHNAHTRGRLTASV